MALGPHLENHCSILPQLTALVISFVLLGFFSTKVSKLIVYKYDILSQHLSITMFYNFSSLITLPSISKAMLNKNDNRLLWVFLSHKFLNDVSVLSLDILTTGKKTVFN